MQIGTVAPYLENQTYQASNNIETSSTDAMETAGDTALLNNAVDGEYQPSVRQVMITALAEQFDVQHLDFNELDQLQQKLQGYGLLTQPLRHAMGQLFTMNSASSESLDINIPAPTGSGDSRVEILNNKEGSQPFNALAIIENTWQQTSGSWQQQQQVGELVRLFANLDSARSIITN